MQVLSVSDGDSKLIFICWLDSIANILRQQDDRSQKDQIIFRHVSPAVRRLPLDLAGS